MVLPRTVSHALYYNLVCRNLIILTSNILQITPLVYYTNNVMPTGPHENEVARDLNALVRHMQVREDQ